MESEHMVQNLKENCENINKKAMKSTALDLFTKLTSNVENVRVNAGINIFKHINSIECPDKRLSEFKHTLDRLVRGVGSVRHNAKCGFYSALVVLAKSPVITIENVLEAITKHLSTSGSNLKGENADICMGQILVCGALIHSEMFYAATQEEQIKIIQIIIKAGKQRSYLSLASYTFLIEVVEKVDENQFSYIWDIIKPEVLKPWTEQTLDTVYLLVKAKNKFPTVINKQLIQKTLNASDIVHKKSVDHLCSVLLNIPSVAFLKHPLYSEIAKSIVNESLIKPVCLEMDKLFQTSNRNKHLIITELLTNMLINLPATNSSVIPDMLTHNYVKHTIYTFKHSRFNSDEEFFNKMDLFFRNLIDKLQEEGVKSETKIAVIEKLLFYPGTFIFEKITKTKLIQQITIGLDEKGVKELLQKYKEVVLASRPRMVSETESNNWINNDRIYAAQLMVKLLGHSSVQKELEWRTEQLKFFVTFGLFKETKDSSIEIELATALKDCFYHALDQKLPKLEDLRNILSSLVRFINNEIFEKNQELRNPITEEITTSWTETMELLSKLENKAHKKRSYAIPVFHTLVLHMGLQLFSNPELAQNSLKELQSCYSRLKTEKRLKKQKMEEGTIEDDEPIWIEVVVDLFLSLLSHNSHLIRSIIGCVFRYLCPHLTLTALRQILDVLDPNNDHNLLSQDEESDLSDEEDNDSDEDESDEESDDSGVEESEEEEESATDRMRMAVRQALHKSGYKTDDESEDIDEMDEEEGKKLDQALSEAFKLVRKTSKGKKTKQSKDDKVLTHFRVRVLDLIEIYLDSNPVMINCLEIALLLLQTLEFSIRDIHQKPLEHRVRSCLKKLSSIKKFSSIEGTTEEVLSKMLKSFLDKGSKSAFIYQDMGNIIAECCIFVIRCLQFVNPENESSKKSKKKQSCIADIFRDSLDTFFKKRDCLLPILLFKNILQLPWDGNWSLVPQLVNFAFDNEIRPFRRSQALELLRIFYCNSRFRTSNLKSFKSNIAPLELCISNKTIELLDRISTNQKECKIKEKFVCLLLQLLTAIKSANASDQMNWIKIGESVRNYRSYVTLSKDAKLAYNKLCRVLNISNIVQMQNKINENGHQEEDLEEATSQTSEDKRLDKKRKKAKSMKKEKQKAKKEAQLLRMKASSEGLSDYVAFSNIPFSEIKDVEEEESTENEPQIKKLKKHKSKLNGESTSEDSQKTKKRYNSEADDRPKKKKKVRNEF